MPQALKGKMKELAKSIGETLKNRREELDISQELLASDLQISRSQLSYIERGEALPKLELLYALCAKLGLTIHEVLPVQEKVIPVKNIGKGSEESLTDQGIQGLMQIMEDD